ncbi:MAG: hypothetical protein U5R31_16895 [Acidimicrobiia bacterium]|nr:hypothetical protein [Acidimicrobiia bacterium]
MIGTRDLSVLFDESVHFRGGHWKRSGWCSTDAFATFDLHKLYAQTSASTFEKIRSSAGSVAELEARLIAHEYREGSWHDSVLLAIRRDHWLSPGNRLRSLMHRDRCSQTEV